MSKDRKAALAFEILEVFHKNPTKIFNYKQVSAELGIKDQSLKKDISAALDHLKDNGTLTEPERGKYKLKPIEAYMTGSIQVTTSGAAYLLNEGAGGDVYIAPKNVKNALNGDKVKIYLYAKKPGSRLEGEVVEIIERARTEFVGVLQVSPKFAFLVPDDPKMMADIFIPLNQLKGAENGQKAIAEIVEWPKNVKNPEGKIVKILGWPGENDTEMHSILAEYGLPSEFPEAIEKEAEKIPEAIPESEIKKRRDFRGVTTFTIDPVDAKDFDDALSIRKVNEDIYEIGVHIADVSHYIQEGSMLDDEAAERATSIYLVDRVVPMLPEKLSNGVCSLRPNEDKLTFSAVFEIDTHGKIYKEWFGRTVIHSDRRFTYEEAQQVIETGTGDYSEEILIMDKIAKKLRNERFKNGAIAFDRAEVKFQLDEKGKPLGVYTKENKDSNKLIEEFMLLANRKVAEFIGKAKPGQMPKTFVYRIHDLPVEDRLSNFAAFAAKFGYKMNLQTNQDISKSLNNLMSDLKGKKEQNVLEQLAIRTMAKAVYTTENIGHYGLAFEYYSHFTSPIRRYPDVIAHRLLDHYLKGGKNVDPAKYEELCKHSTEMEIRASEAERASIKYKQVEFLKDQVGEEFDGLISGVTEWGIYVELVANKCEGMVRLRDIAGDFYQLDDENYCVIGMRTGRKFQLGDPVKVKVKKADLLKKQLDFELLDSAGKSFEEEFNFNEERPRRHSGHPSGGSKMGKQGGKSQKKHYRGPKKK